MNVTSKFLQDQELTFYSISYPKSRKEVSGSLTQCIVLCMVFFCVCSTPRLLSSKGKVVFQNHEQDVFDHRQRDTDNRHVQLTISLVDSVWAARLRTCQQCGMFGFREEAKTKVRRESAIRSVWC